MKFQPKSHLMSRFLPLIGAVIFLGTLPVTALAQIGPDLKVTKVCANGPLQSVLCTVTVTNIGSVPSVSPLSLTDVVTGAPANALFTGGGGTLPISCTPGAGPVLPIACSANIALLPNQPKTALFSFKLPTGGSFTNCATVTQAQNAATLPDPNPANNTNICTTITVLPPSGGGGPITIVTPPPLGACITQTPVSGLHYPAQSCNQSTPGFLAGMMTSYHFTSKCTAPNTLLGVTNVTCQNAPIPGFPTGSVYQGTACCGTVAPPVPDLGVKKTCQVFTNSGQPPAATCTVTVTNLNSTVPAVLPITLKDTITGPNPAMLTGAGGTLNPSGPGPANVNGVLTTFTGNTPLAGGTSGTMLISYNFPSGGGTYTNCATVTQAQPDPIPANNTNVCTTFTVPPPTGTGTGTGTLTIVKVVQPQNNPQAFTFTSNVSVSIPTFQLDNNPSTGTIPNSKTFTNLPAGVPYTVTESAVSGWTTPSLQCLVAVPGSATTFTDQLNRTFTVNLAAGANVTCTFTNLKTP